MNSKIDFSLLLASTVHDMKNSIGMLLSTVEELDQSVSEEDLESKQKLAKLHAGSARINNDLVHLLGMYRVEQDQLTLNYTECYLSDLLHEQMTINDILFESNGITVELECDESLCWFFDEQLIADVINNVLVNAAKYADTKIKISASTVDGYLKISVLDDGRGYPEKMLVSLDALKVGLDFSTGSTQLGLFFAARMAEQHENEDRTGYIKLENIEGGGMFSIFLP